MGFLCGLGWQLPCVKSLNHENAQIDRRRVARIAVYHELGQTVKLQVVQRLVLFGGWNAAQSAATVQGLTGAIPRGFLADACASRKLRMLHFAVALREPRANFLGVVQEGAVAALVGDTAALVQDVEPLGPGGVGVVAYAAFFVQAPRIAPIRMRPASG